MACSPVGCLTACVVYGRFDSRFDSNEKKRFAGPYVEVQLQYAAGQPTEEVVVRVNVGLAVLEQRADESQ